MDFQLFAQVGWSGAAQALGVLPIGNARIASAAQFAGSYHVLEMGRHFDDYVEAPNLPALPNGLAIPGFPVMQAYVALGAKQRAAAVTGNIGEAVAAIVARRSMGLTLTEIAHLKTQRPFTRRKSPDYLLRLRGAVPAPFAFTPVLQNNNYFPEWWPAESKARSSEGGAGPAREAFLQLCAYWWSIEQHSPNDVGFGLAVVCVYDAQGPEVRVHVFVPSNGPALRAALQQWPNYRDFMRAVTDDYTLTGAHVHGCA